MQVIDTVNVNTAFTQDLPKLLGSMISRRSESRNGPVENLGSLTTVYRKPFQRMLRLPRRDANPIFHVIESLWMLAGQDDVASMSSMVPSMASYGNPESGKFDGAYGARWRSYFSVDQIPAVVKELSATPNSRRAVIGMYDAATDVPRWSSSKDIPCNLAVKFDITYGCLNMFVFNRSNDIMLGAYGANAVHFSVLHEYVFRTLRFLDPDLQPGRYEQISADSHLYTEALYGEQKAGIFQTPFTSDETADPYADGSYQSVDWFSLGALHTTDAAQLISLFNHELSNFRRTFRQQFLGEDVPFRPVPRHPFFEQVVDPLLRSYRAFKAPTRDWDVISSKMESIERFSNTYLGNPHFDVYQNTREWYLRRAAKEGVTLL